MLEPEGIDVSRSDKIYSNLEDSLIDKQQIKKDIKKDGEISDLFDKKVLLQFEHEFATSDTGNNSLSEAQFKELVSAYIPSALADNMYRSIDVNDVGCVNYSDFTNYLISAEAGSTFSSKTYASRLMLRDQQSDGNGVNLRELMDCLIYTRKPQAILVTGTSDGLIALWDPNDFSLIKSVVHRDKSAVRNEELNKAMDTRLKAHCRKNFVRANSKQSVSHSDLN